MSGCISHLFLGFIVGVLQPVVAILHEKDRRMRILDGCMESLEHLLLLDLNSISVGVTAQRFSGVDGTEDGLFDHHF